MDQPDHPTPLTELTLTARLDGARTRQARAVQSIPDVGGVDTEAGRAILTARITLQTTDAPELLAAIDAVLALHRADDDGDCVACGIDRWEDPIPWPCATVKAIAGALGVQAPRPGEHTGQEASVHARAAEPPADVDATTPPADVETADRAVAAAKEAHSAAHEAMRAAAAVVLGLPPGPSPERNVAEYRHLAASARANAADLAWDAAILHLRAAKYDASAAQWEAAVPTSGERA